MERTGAAAGAVVSGDKGGVGGEYLFEEVVEVLKELFLDHGDVVDGHLAEDQGGVVVLTAGMLDEQQTRGDGG